MPLITFLIRIKAANMRPYMVCKMFHFKTTLLYVEPVIYSGFILVSFHNFLLKEILWIWSVIRRHYLTRIKVHLLYTAA